MEENKIYVNSLERGALEQNLGAIIADKVIVSVRATTIKDKYTGKFKRCLSQNQGLAGVIWGDYRLVS